MYNYSIVVHPIVMEASSSEDRKYMRSMTKGDIHQVNGTLIQKLYQSTMERNTCDFGDIPKSKGDITKVKYYGSTVECLSVLQELLKLNNISEPGVTEINTAIKNVQMLKPDFERGFKANSEYLILLYNTTVMAIIDSTSMLIATYMDFIVGPDQERYVANGRFDKGRGLVSLENLKQFNTIVKNGSVAHAIDYALKETRSDFAGTGAVITVAVIGGLLAVVPLTRELIFFFTRKRIELADYMELQAQFLEMHKLAVKNSKAHSDSERKEILRKQDEVIRKLRRTRDKLTIKNDDATDAVKKDIKKDNELLSLSNLEKSIADEKMNGVNTLNVI